MVSTIEFFECPSEAVDHRVCALQGDWANNAKLQLSAGYTKLFNYH